LIFFIAQHNSKMTDMTHVPLPTIGHGDLSRFYCLGQGICIGLAAMKSIVSGSFAFWSRNPGHSPRRLTGTVLVEHSWRALGQSAQWMLQGLAQQSTPMSQIPGPDEAIASCLI
jgi:hypothetical protein